MKIAKLQAIEAKFLGETFGHTKLYFWASSTTNCVITDKAIDFSFTYRTDDTIFVYKVSAKSKDGYLYDGYIYQDNDYIEDIRLRRFSNGDHQLLIGDWTEAGIYYQFTIEL